MALTFHANVVDQAEAEAARRLLRAAQFLETQHKQRLSIPADKQRKKHKRDVVRKGKLLAKKGSSYTVYTPSQPGQYPRLRTGHGRGSVTKEPASAAAVRAAGLKVRVGYRLPPGVYMTALELRHARKGLLDTLNDLRGQLRAIMEQKAP